MLRILKGKKKITRSLSLHWVIDNLLFYARVQYLGWEDPLEKEVATHSSILAWIPPYLILTEAELPEARIALRQRVRRD